MTDTLSTTLSIGVSARQAHAEDLGSGTFSMTYSKTKQLPTGTSSGKADLLFSDTRTIAASGNEDLDLAGGLEDAFGQTLTFVKVKSIYIKAADGNTNSVIVKPAASNGFTGPFGAAAHQVSIPPGGWFAITAPAAGWTVTADTGDLLHIANSSGTTGVTYDVSIVGTSA
jgi:hypothetical protein